MIRDLISYLKYKNEINHNFWYAIKEGYCYDENMNWQERLNYWRKCMTYEPPDEN